MRLRNTGTVVNFRAALPAWMEPAGQAFIEIDARPAGRINSAFIAACEAAELANKLRAKPENDADRIMAMQEHGRDLMAAVYDTCVVEWRTNLVDDETGNALTCDRATFLELADVRIAEVSDAFRGFVEAIKAAGQKVLDDTEATAKN